MCEPIRCGMPIGSCTGPLASDGNSWHLAASQGLIVGEDLAPVAPHLVQCQVLLSWFQTSWCIDLAASSSIGTMVGLMERGLGSIAFLGDLGKVHSMWTSLFWILSASWQLICTGMVTSVGSSTCLAARLAKWSAPMLSALQSGGNHCLASLVSRWPWTQCMLTVRPLLEISWKTPTQRSPLVEPRACALPL